MLKSKRFQGTGISNYLLSSCYGPNIVLAALGAIQMCRSAAPLNSLHDFLEVATDTACVESQHNISEP